ncbi:MAG TPA: ABC transporter ATP-binding protein, partial [Gemmatimonadales bacterium]|nr:ABC transporter ATP-binding protein [Gemmatimonadales bacterium]
LQALLIWALRRILEGFSRPQGLTIAALAGGAAIVLGLWLTRAFSVFAAETLSVRLSHRVETESMLEVLERLLVLPVRFFDRHSQADVVMAAYHDLKGIRSVTLEVGRIVLYATQLLGLAVAAWTMNPLLAVIGLVTVPIGVVPARRMGQRITHAARAEHEAVVTLYDSFFQVATGARVIKVNRAQGRLLERAREIARVLHRQLVRQAESRGWSRFLLEAVSGLGLIAVLTLGGREVARGHMTWQAMLGLLVAIMAVYNPLVGLVQMYGNVQSILPSLDRVDAILREPEEQRDRAGARPLLDAPATIALEDVSFAYRDRLVLDGITARFHRGETIGIVGPSGAGKSTLLSLLLGFHHPTSGAILLDGHDLRAIRHADLMALSALVLQDPFLFTDTVANNIRIGRPEAGLDEVIAAARSAHIHDEILAMERGYDTVVGLGRGSRAVSGGQRQRLSIAAALLKNAPLLFLDEATSSLDSVSEIRVQAAVAQLMRGRTTFVIAHRLSTLRNADRLVVLDRGRLVGLGTHAELLAECPTYWALWERQVAGAGALELLSSAGGTDG